jgi:hypothetical protein|tara:strand:- start:205 stop:537 length:333 start_codon:yes stop_codon:yes gene_type:complete
MTPTLKSINTESISLSGEAKVKMFKTKNGFIFTIWEKTDSPIEHNYYTPNNVMIPVDPEENLALLWGFELGKSDFDRLELIHSHLGTEWEVLEEKALTCRKCCSIKQHIH